MNTKKLLTVGTLVVGAVAAPLASEARPHFGGGPRYHGGRRHAFWGGFSGGLVGGLVGSYFAPRRVIYTTPCYYVEPAPVVVQQQPVVVQQQPAVVQQPVVVQQQVPVQQPAPAAQPAPVQQAAQAERPKLEDGETLIVQSDGTYIITKQKIELNQTVERVRE